MRDQRYFSRPGSGLGRLSPDQTESEQLAGTDNPDRNPIRPVSSSIRAPKAVEGKKIRRAQESCEGSTRSARTKKHLYRSGEGPVSLQPSSEVRRLAITESVGGLSLPAVERVPGLDIQRIGCVAMLTDRFRLSSGRQRHFVANIIGCQHVFG
jgi:hypothetical protein